MIIEQTMNMVDLIKVSEMIFKLMFMNLRVLNKDETMINNLYFWGFSLEFSFFSCLTPNAFLHFIKNFFLNIFLFALLIYRFIFLFPFFFILRIKWS